MLLGTIGVPLAGLFLLLLLASLFVRRTRAFSGQLLVRALGVGIGLALVMWLFALGSMLPAPFHYQAGLTVLPFGFAIGGFVFFFVLLRQSKDRAKNGSA